MRVLIIGDIEGVSGVVKPEQGRGGEEKLYDEARRLYTEEVNAAVRGAARAGSDEIVALDCHGAGGPWTFNSLVPELLDERCDWVVQNRWTEYTAFLEEGCDAALLIGMHARAGAGDGVLSHTVSGTDWYELRFNGEPVGETAINAALCGTWGCPVVMVTGDDVVCREARDLLGEGLTTVVVKEGLGRYSARNYGVKRVRQLIEEGAATALADLGAVPAYIPDKPCTIEVTYRTADRTEKFRHIPMVEIADPRKIVVKGDDWWSAWRSFYFVEF